MLWKVSVRVCGWCFVGRVGSSSTYFAFSLFLFFLLLFPLFPSFFFVFLHLFFFLLRLPSAFYFLLLRLSSAFSFFLSSSYFFCFLFFFFCFFLISSFSCFYFHSSISKLTHISPEQRQLEKMFPRAQQTPRQPPCPLILRMAAQPAPKSNLTEYMRQPL